MFLYCSHQFAMLPNPHAARIAPHGQAHALLRLPELRRRLRPLAGQVRRLRRVEHASPRKARRPTAPIPGRSPRKGRVFALEPLAGETHEAPRLPSGMPELDRVTGGGFVRGSVLLMARRSRHRQIDAADPGRRRARAAPATARSTSPARRRSRRCGCAPSGSASAEAPVELAAETSVEDIVATLSRGQDAAPRSSSTRSRPCGPTRSNPRPAPSRRCAARRRR